MAGFCRRTTSLPSTPAGFAAAQRLYGRAHDVGAAGKPVVEALACRAFGDGDADRDEDHATGHPEPCVDGAVPGSRAETRRDLLARLSSRFIANDDTLCTPE